MTRDPDASRAADAVDPANAVSGFVVHPKCSDHGSGPASDAPAPPRQTVPYTVEPLPTAEQIMAGTLAPDGVLRLNVNIAVDLREFADWPPRCVSAFLAGIAQILGAEAYAKEVQGGR